jgi:HSP20 family molecular chaperone IbpA
MTTRAIDITRMNSIRDQLARWHDEIRLRAYHRFLERGGSDGAALEDWLSAERDLSLEPAIEVKQKGGRLEITAPLPDVDPTTLDVQVTTEDVLIKAEMETGRRVHGDAVRSTNGPAQVFRAIRLPASIDPDRVKAAYSKGQLRLTALIVALPSGQVELRQ